MKTIVNQLRFAMLLGFMAITMTVWSQIQNIEKLSIPTQMFLEQLEGKANFDEVPGTKFTSSDPVRRASDKFERPFSKPDTIDGKVYMSAFIRISDDSGIASLEEEGVIVQCTFDDGLLTALIPIDKLTKVADLEVVTRIEVATPMFPHTDKAREATNVDDVLNLSADAYAAGLDKKYDGSGVIVGIIDTGIDLQHIAFKDKDGNSRIKRAYVYNGNSANEYSTIGTSSPTTDDSSEDHGTHTSSAAGGSSVIIDGSSVTVTDDHANATYGGMAPGADLYLAAINGLNSTYIANAFQKIIQYANSVNKPLVISNSWGSHMSPHDGTGSTANIVNQYFGDNHPDRICLFSAGNTSSNAPASEGGGCHVTGTASSNNPLRTILRYYGQGGDYYSGIIASAWCRSTNVNSMGCRIYVLDTSTGNILSTFNANPNSGSSVTVSGIDTYYSGTLYVYRDYVSSNKTQIMLYTTGLQSRSSNHNYSLAIELYPPNGEAIIDIWGGNYGYFTAFVNTPGYNWTNGTDDGGMGDNATIPNVISIGAYSTKNRITDYTGTTYAYGYTVGDIANFSSYGTPSMTPLGEMYPWISAPGARTVAAVNHYHTGDDESYIDGDSSRDRVNASTTYPYGAMQGTSMSTPVAAGIVALWMQACKEADVQITHSYIKEVMQETAIRDSWVTTGPNATHFGNGKIDALAGIQYILGVTGTTDPVIYARPTDVTFEGMPNETYTKTVTVTGRNLTGDIIATLNDPNGVYTINPTNLGQGGELVITYAPRSVGSHGATITLSSPGAEDVIITINGTASLTKEITIFDGTDQNAFLPIFGYYYDERQVNQMIYPAEELTELQGTALKSMKFYSPNLYFSEGSYNVKVGTTTQSTYPSDLASIVRLAPEDMTTVAAGLSATAGGTILTINFDPNNPFIYEGGNLLVDFEVTQVGNYGSEITNFFGQNQSTNTSFVSHADVTHSVNANGIYDTSSSTYNYSSARQFLPKVTIIGEGIIPDPVLMLDPAEVAIEDETDADRSATVTVVSDYLTGNLTVAASNHWSANLYDDDTKLSVTYNGRALHQTGAASVTSAADGLTASVSADYLYTGPIYIVGDVNNIGWTTSGGHCNGVAMTRDDDGVYTATVTAQAGGENRSWIFFTKSLDAPNFDALGNYRFGPESNGNWGLHTDMMDNRDQMCKLDTVGNLHTIFMDPNKSYRIIIDSKNNQFMIHEIKSDFMSSNTVTVKVYHSDLQVVDDGNVYTQEQVVGDVNGQLPASEGNLSFNILVKGDEEITRYYLDRKIGDNGSWTVVALAQHEGNTFLPQNGDHSSQGAAVTMPDGAAEMWLPLKDNASVADVVTYYVPITVADGVVTQGNTYGAPIQSAVADKVTLQVTITGSKSDQRWGGHWDMEGTDYCVYTPVITIESNDFNPQIRRPFMYRAWLTSGDAWDFERVDNVITATSKFTLPHPLGEYVVPADQTDAHIVIIGEDWSPKTDWSVKLDNAFAAPSINADLRIVVRAYYEKVPAGTNLRDGEAKYRIAEHESEGTFDLPTAVVEFVGDREIVGVTFVNSLGQISDQPFEGVNIIVTRYSDGSTSTTKVLK